MKPFDYLSPTTLAEAASAWGDTGRTARLLAGGTDLTVALRHGHLAADVVIDLKRVDEFAGGIAATPQGLRIPATATMKALGRYLEDHGLLPSLEEAAAVVGSVQIRNRATLAGNICNASPAADTVPVLAAFGASVEMHGPSGVRQRLVADFIEGNRKIDLAPGEIVTAVVIPLPDRPRGCAFDRITRRRGVDLASANLCCTITEAGEVTFAFGAVAPRPLVVRDDTGVLADPTAGKEDRARAIAGLIAAATPISDVRASARYRMAMLAVMAERSLSRARNRLQEAMNG